jgi:NAD(P)H-hydrate epimerase
MKNIPSLTVDQMVEVDRLMIEVYDISLEQMMENAGRNLAEMARQMLGGTVEGRTIAALCGPGNNGGGGMVAARHLHNWGAQVHLILAGGVARLKNTPRHQYRILENIGIQHGGESVAGADLVLDALLGYGGRGDPRAPIAEWIEKANAGRARILSLDSPSGLDATTGEAGKPCIRASATLTLALPKTGLLVSRATQNVGELHVADIGVPRELYAGPSLGLEVGGLFAESAIVRVD